MKLCIALDNPSKEENLKLAKELKEYAKELWLKVGFRSYIRDGAEFIKELKLMGYNVFLDLKLYDIPNTMADAAEEIANLGVDMFNVHASAGSIALKTVMQRLEKYEKRPLVLAVTALTSFTDEEFKKIYGDSIENKAKEFAKLSHEAGLDGVVCSAFESKMIKNITDEKFITLTPGIRPFGEDAGDQARVADISLAKEQKVDFIVVGRPIYKDEDPKAKVEKILNKIKEI
ncbi:orotidine 5'-phosphate decarboxylase [Nautilia profundicola AmH]|uniref:Orotidine 5'-phosphate decarboxylase n=1 Tax=Nautilia profundicola (strain ATCC BAA-1463 / DSM 18972 / AmH) TaxID=598659 RepID=PYRF_NAUPA|nr:orotidine-5'-phosphate decarboxylase [Nautilia profundicola]B9L788.1 RecName: Full=Orotidine 5'-phosphate decarboxylase; AltName: Full=OMP decarboxylase; Short=OMPDCase; Short=OMPdecase [Nautilia profundicola AmH]ACM92743.1 orotidine 5'-phosphate decarboxylase [Nautilia profundicola AmH]